MTALSGANAVLKVARSGGTLVDVSAFLLGYDGFELNAVEEALDVTSGGGSGSQGSGFVDATGTFTVDENGTTAPLFVGGNGKLFDMELSRTGTSSGSRKETMTAYLQVVHTFEARGKRRFAVTANVNTHTVGTH